MAGAEDEEVGEEHAGRKRKRKEEVAAAEATRRGAQRAANKLARGKDGGGGRKTPEPSGMDAVRRRGKGLKRKERALRESGVVARGVVGKALKQASTKKELKKRRR